MKTLYIICGMILSCLGEARGQNYDLIGLGTFGGTGSAAFGINNEGQVVGGAGISPNNNSHAFLYSSGLMQDLGTLGGSINDGSQAFGINDAGQIIGQSTINATAVGHAFLYSSGSMLDLTPSGGNSYASAINNNGQIVGYIGSGSTIQAFLYSGGSLHTLGTLDGIGSYATAVNESGQVAGNIYYGTAITHAFLYSGVSMQNIGTLGGSSAQAFGINDNGLVTGFANTSSGNPHAFLYTNGSMQDLGTLSGIYNYGSIGYGINASGEVVGQSYDQTGRDENAFIYSNGSMENLNSLISPTLGWTLEQANAINNAGDIVGLGSDALGQTEAYLLVPKSVPEPATVALFVFGAACMFWWRT